MTDWLLKRHTQICYYYYCYLTLLSLNAEPGGMVQGRAQKGLGVLTIQGRGVGRLPGVGGAGSCFLRLLRVPIGHLVTGLRAQLGDLGSVSQPHPTLAGELAKISWHPQPPK